MNSISEATQAVLLLCGVLPGERGAEPLSAADFFRLVNWCEKQSLSITSLLHPDALGKISEGEHEHQIQPERIKRLIDRGMSIALATERWLQMGLWIYSVLDKNYPPRLREKLGERTAPLLFGVGNMALLSKGGLAVVGSRNADEPALEFSRRVGELSAQNNFSVISGAARGVDLAAMLGGLEAGGNSVGVLANNLAREAVAPETRVYLESGNLVLISPVSPEAPFHAGNAMARNKYIYALADYALVVSSDAETGGTWNGAVENLKNKWCPLFVRDGEDIPEGNRKLLRKGGLSFSSDDLLSNDRFLGKLDSSSVSKDESAQASLFSEGSRTNNS